MEELRSTDVLDKEILDDSRKKAERLLAKAEEDSQALLAGVNDRVAGAQRAAKAASEQRIALYRKNVNASLPLEKERYQVSFVYGAMIDAMNAYFDGAGAEKRLAVIERLVSRALPSIGGRTVTALVVGMDTAATEKMLRKTLGAALASVSAGAGSLLAADAVAGFSRREGVILRTSDGALTCRLTLDERVKEILDDQTYELASTLFCGRLPE